MIEIRGPRKPLELETGLVTMNLNNSYEVEFTYMYLIHYLFLQIFQ